ncbi:PLP-dependent aminotransferase family protein [Paraburkholderia sp. J7]|uniref:aminotransferase-like domain-containing protein n=1 Tax=Paraburkholderia sp. J7 TaxID=2805438 RepID=UPI002AB63152|nr:PLP-dependent aminotransferase family protein [Paraburkholderia sp. J7]
MDTHTPFRYEQLAELIVGMINNGALAPGMRLPSVRAISEQHRMSVSTALQAYRMLEDRGVLVSRPQSGFYVAAARRGALALPSASRPRAKASTVSISAAVAALLEHASNSTLIPLGCAVPDAALLQSKRLDLGLARAARQHGMRYNTYSSPHGEPRLRREIARRAMRVGHALSPDDVLVTCGCTEALALALSAVASRGDTIAIESPTYFGFLHTIEMLGLKAFELPTHPTHGIDVGALARLLETEPVAACLLSSSFNNPLGSAMAEADKLALLAVLTRHAVPLIEDDVYGDIHFGRDRPKPFIALDGGANTIYCSSFSKSLAPGYRVGWIAAGAYTQQVMERKLAFSLCCPVLPQIALADFLESGAYDSHLRSIRRIFEENLARMTRTIEASFPAETKVSRPAGGFVLWLELPRRFDSRALFDEALEQGICFAPGDVFSASRRFRNCLRLSAGHDWDERMEDGVRRLGRLACAQLARQSALANESGVTKLSRLPSGVRNSRARIPDG